MNLREWMRRRRDRAGAALLWSALMLGIHQDEPPPAWFGAVLRDLPEGVMVEFWDRCSEAGIARPGCEYPAWTDFDGFFYVMMRRASGRTLPEHDDWLFGWREMHPYLP